MLLPGEVSKTTSSYIEKSADVIVITATSLKKRLRMVSQVMKDGTLVCYQLLTDVLAS